MFHLCPKNLLKAEWNNNGLISFLGEISQQPNINFVPVDGTLSIRCCGLVGEGMSLEIILEVSQFLCDYQHFYLP